MQRLNEAQLSGKSSTHKVGCRVQGLRDKVKDKAGFLVEVRLGPGRVRLVHPKVLSQRVDKSDPAKRGIAVPTWKPLTLHHIAPDQSMTFEKKQDLKDYCKKHKLRSGALE